MNNIYKAKQSIVIALILIIIGTVFMTIKTRREVAVKTEEGNTPEIIETTEARNLCYYRADKTNNDFYDRAWIKLNIVGDQITGEFQNLPAETDSKVGKFKGTVGPVDQQKMARTANVWWDSLAEGMNVTEELMIEFGDGSATAGFGEMVNRGDGVYVYKSKENLFYIKQMNQIDCEYLDEKIFVEKYVRDNIASITTDKAVLGGTWYVISVAVNSSTKTGEVTYEDGHIQNKATFIYTYETRTNDITFTKFDIKK